MSQEEYSVIRSTSVKSNRDIEKATQSQHFVSSASISHLSSSFPTALIPAPSIRSCSIPHFSRHSGKWLFAVRIVPVENNNNNASQSSSELVGPYTVWRRWEDFQDLSLELTRLFPFGVVSANNQHGSSPSAKNSFSIPKLSRKLTLFNTRSNLTQRREELDAFVQQLFKIPATLIPASLIDNFFGVWESCLDGHMNIAPVSANNGSNATSSDSRPRSRSYSHLQQQYRNKDATSSKLICSDIPFKSPYGEQLAKHSSEAEDEMPLPLLSKSFTAPPHPPAGAQPTLPRLSRAVTGPPLPESALQRISQYHKTASVPPPASMSPKRQVAHHHTRTLSSTRSIMKSPTPTLETRSSVNSDFSPAPHANGIVTLPVSPKQHSRKQSESKSTEQLIRGPAQPQPHTRYMLHSHSPSSVAREIMPTSPNDRRGPSPSSSLSIASDDSTATLRPRSNTMKHNMMSNVVPYPHRKVVNHFRSLQDIRHVSEKLEQHRPGTTTSNYHMPVIPAEMATDLQSDSAVEETVSRPPTPEEKTSRSSSLSVGSNYGRPSYYQMATPTLSSPSLSSSSAGSPLSISHKYDSDFSGSSRESVGSDGTSLSSYYNCSQSPSSLSSGILAAANNSNLSKFPKEEVSSRYYVNSEGHLVQRNTVPDPPFFPVPPVMSSSNSSISSAMPSKASSTTTISSAAPSASHSPTPSQSSGPRARSCSVASNKGAIGINQVKLKVITTMGEIIAMVVDKNLPFEQIKEKVASKVFTTVMKTEVEDIYLKLVNCQNEKASNTETVCDEALWRTTLALNVQRVTLKMQQN